MISFKILTIIFFLTIKSTKLLVRSHSFGALSALLSFPALGQVKKRRRRDARAGSEAPKARCTGRVRSAEGAMHGQGQKRERQLRTPEP